MIEALAAIAPGQPLREGLDRILQANMGALIVVDDGPDILGICSGGFLLDAEFSPQRLSELAKMDGAIILAADASRIARANVHLVPNPIVPTSETGTRHRTAERVARSIDVPVISVSEDMSVITLYRGDAKHGLQSVARLLGRTNQALQTLERYRDRLDTVTSSLSALEVEDLVTVRDVVTVLQRAEMVRRIAEEIEGYIVELGADGRLARLQLDELLAGVEDERRHVVRDYLPDDDAQLCRRGGGRPRNVVDRAADGAQDGGRGAQHRRHHGPRVQPDAAGVPAAGPYPPTPRCRHQSHRGPLRQPAEGHAGHLGRPRSGARRRAGHRPGRQGRADPIG